MNFRELIRQPKNLNDRIWRYMDLPKLIYMLEQRKLYLSRADRFDDKHEGATPEAQRIWEAEHAPGFSEGVAPFRQRQRQWTFISCWSHCNYESHALWRIFCGPAEGVAVASQYLQLFELFNPDKEDKDVELGLVDYGRDEPIPFNTLVPFFRKRKAFDYEREARLVANIYRYRDMHEREGNLLSPRSCLEIPIHHLSSFVQEIRIHPEASANYVDVARSIVGKYAPELLDRVRVSELSESPKF